MDAEERLVDCTRQFDILKQDNDNKKAVQATNKTVNAELVRLRKDLSDSQISVSDLEKSKSHLQNLINTMNANH